MKPVQVVLDDNKLNQFVDRVEGLLGPGPRGVVPLPLPASARSETAARASATGPRGPTWALPIPGETFQFKTGPQPPAPRLPPAN